MYTCFLTNFGWYSGGQFKTMDEAIAHGKSTGFEFTVYKNTLINETSSGNTYHEELVASWRVFGGTTLHV